MRLVLLAVGCALSAIMGGWVTSRHYEAQIAEREQAYAQEALLQAERVKQADREAMQAQVEVAQLRTRVAEVGREAVARTRGRECLSAGVRVRVNDAIAVSNAPAGVAGAAPAAEAPAGDEAATDAGRGDGEAGASDTAVVEWMLEAVEAYETCRAQVNALRRWHAMVERDAGGEP